ncbi:MAG: YidC/Oxa1 family membrane protein insertase [Chloroflexi bacterium]|nr:YidC/Oxa1 family membrane protein insertase [Chloroflexota bacterium]
MFDFIAYPLANLMLLLYYLLGHSTVVAITVLTILINLALLPLTMGQQKSARRMQDLQPEMEKLQKKYAKDKERLAQEQMKLYKEKGVNPMGGCLPLLVQMPIWFGLYRAIVYIIPTTPLDVFQFSGHIYKWLPGIEGLLPLQSNFLGMDLGQPPGMPQWWSYALPVLVFVTSWLQQKLLTPPTPSAGEQSQAAMMSQQMQIMMPLMFMFFTLQWATGLSIYFIVSNLIRIGQYYLFPGTRSVAGSGQKPAASEAKS